MQAMEHQIEEFACREEFAQSQQFCRVHSVISSEFSIREILTVDISPTNRA